MEESGDELPVDYEQFLGFWKCLGLLIAGLEIGPQKTCGNPVLLAPAKDFLW